MLTAITCIMCQPTPDNPQPRDCNPNHCPRLAPPGHAAVNHRRHTAAVTRSRRTIIPTPPDILNDQAEPEDLTLAAVPYRAVTNSAGRTIMAKTGSRRCDPRCQNARGPQCVCSCGGRNHGIG